MTRRATERRVGKGAVGCRRGAGSVGNGSILRDGGDGVEGLEAGWDTETTDGDVKDEIWE